AGSGRSSGTGDAAVLPPEAFAIQPLQEAERSVDPGAVAVGKGGPVVRLPPHEQARRPGRRQRLLQAVAVVGAVVLVDDAVADDARNRVVERSEAKNELAASRRRRRGAGGERVEGREEQRDRGDEAHVGHLQPRLGGGGRSGPLATTFHFASSRDSVGMYG